MRAKLRFLPVLTIFGGLLDLALLAQLYRFVRRIGRRGIHNSGPSDSRSHADASRHRREPYLSWGHSTGASVTFVRRMDQFARRDDLECVTVTGALIGAYLAGVVPQEVLEFLFALMML
jgi:hypothetical protein